MEYQLASPGDHRINSAERAIQTYKNHFISTLQGTDPDYPENGWDLLMPQINITLNLLRASRVNPKLSREPPIAHFLILARLDMTVINQSWVLQKIQLIEESFVLGV